MKNYFIKNKDKTFKLQNLILLIIIFALYLINTFYLKQLNPFFANSQGQNPGQSGGHAESAGKYEFQFANPGGKSSGGRIPYLRCGRCRRNDRVRA